MYVYWVNPSSNALRLSVVGERFYFCGIYICTCMSVYAFICI